MTAPNPTPLPEERAAVRRKRLSSAVLFALGCFLLMVVLLDEPYLRARARLVAPFGILSGLLGMLWPKAVVDPKAVVGPTPDDRPRIVPNDADTRARAVGCGVGLVGFLLGLAWLVYGIVEWSNRGGQ